MAIPEISPAWNQILTTLTTGAIAWRTPTELSRLLGRDPEELTDELAAMDEAGWLDVWERPGPEEIAVTLSAWGAGRLGVRLAESGGGLSLRWIEAGQPEPPNLRARGVAASAALEDLDLVLDSLPFPGSRPDDLDDETAPPKEGRDSATFWPCPTQAARRAAHPLAGTRDARHGLASLPRLPGETPRPATILPAVRPLGARSPAPAGRGAGAAPADAERTG